MIRRELKQYILENIFPEYEKNDSGHGINHILYVIRRGFSFAETVLDINQEMVYVTCCYHDVGYHIDRKNHEKVSADILRQDQRIKDFFDDKEIKIMAEAIEDHRASLVGEPRSIYGKIVSSADRNTDIDETLQKTYAYRLKYHPEFLLDELIEDARLHLISRFGEDGFSRDKIYFEDQEYSKYLEDLTKLAKDKAAFFKRYKKVNNLS